MRLRKDWELDDDWLIRHGASKVFAATTGDDGEVQVDIDQILDDGEKRTKDLDKKMDGMLKF